MRYVTHIERRAMQEGIEQGAFQATRANLMEILNLRFSPIPQELTDLIQKLNDLDQLKLLLTQAVTAETLEEFEQWTEENLPGEAEQP